MLYFSLLVGISKGLGHELWLIVSQKSNVELFPTARSSLGSDLVHLLLFMDEKL
jgi:hypothetical protein